MLPVRRFNLSSAEQVPNQKPIAVDQMQLPYEQPPRPPTRRDAMDEQPARPPTRRTWLPAAAIPLGILAFRRISRNNALAKTPPRRTASASSSTLPHTTVVEALPTTAPVPKTSLNIRALIRDVIRPGLVIKARPPMEAVLRMAMAFGIATTGVAVTSAATIWGGMAVLGVNNVHEISYRMRSMLAHRMPVITSRIHNLHTYSDEDDTPDSVSQWNWVATRQRLQEIYDTEGFLAWSEAALEEMEIEARLERFHRKQADALRPA